MKIGDEVEFVHNYSCENVIAGDKAVVAGFLKTNKIDLVSVQLNKNNRIIDVYPTRLRKIKKFESHPLTDIFK